MFVHESDMVELKETYVDDIRKEIIAFANTSGGTIYIGVKDNGEIVGLDDLDAVTLQIANVCRDAIKPDITLFLGYEPLLFEGKNVLAVHIQPGTSKPYYLSAKGLKPSGVYVRQGTSSAPASDEAIRRMIKETDGDRFEEARSVEQELTFVEAEKAFGSREIRFGPMQMKTLGMINEEGLYTNLALLLSDQCPHIIKAATFSGKDREEFQDRREFTGSLLKQLNEAYSYLDMRNQTKATFQGLYRTDRRDYSERAIREALLNAIEHRDYSFMAPTLISVFPDRIEFVSYGGLAAGAQMEDILNGLSVCRNRNLANVFYRLELVEAYGTGLARIQRAYAGRDEQPRFQAGPNSFRVVLPNMNIPDAKRSNDGEVSSTGPFVLREGSSSAAEIAMRYIKEHGEVTRSELEKHLGLSAPTAVRLLKKLKDSGQINTIGNGKNTRYKA